ncbi:hypothetical protein WR25_07503 [Diploscapter pachys]|uniref:C-type lectin domain-containing protein n=1 Tax=Diploscapter pachys TaxID=2018661 RepID=A0A2A2JK49_9BILA|nr:hypothetical protein WR25_07503 [Diploscapter pachys]
MYGEMDVPSTSNSMKPSRFPNLTYDNPSQLEPFLSQCSQYGCQTQFINDDLYVLIEVSEAMGCDNFYQVKVLPGIPPEVNRNTIDPKNGDCLVMKWLSKPLGTVQWVSVDCRQSSYYFCQKAPASGFNP